MTDASLGPLVEMIPVDRITVLNPRARNQKTFQEIVDNIARIGLKRPITVTRRVEGDGDVYDLVCGQGRLEAYRSLGQHEVPALVVSAEPEDCLIASLVENCARRQHRSLDLLQDISGMRNRGHSVQDIARKTGLSAEYVYGVARLLERGEQRLLSSVEKRLIPISVAVEIAEADEVGVQRALQDAYEKGVLKGKKLLAAKRLVELRRRRGKGLSQGSRKRDGSMSSDDLLRAYQEDTERKRDMIRRSNATRDRLILITESMRRLSGDEQFLALLEDEDLTTVPEHLAVRLDEAHEDPR